MKALVKPPALKSGDKIGIIAPASSFNRAGFDAGCERLRQMGYEPVYSETIFDHDLYFAGSTERRAHELDEMLERSDIAALICARGGYGSNYLLEHVDFQKFNDHPKILLGCSDITTLLTGITDRTGLVTFHGPMVAKDIAAADGMDASSWKNALTGAESWSITMDGVEVLHHGKAKGRLYGGCLFMLGASLGTEFEIQNHDTLLFLEGICARTYRIDRMLMQLHLAGKLKNVRGIIFGEMLGCAAPAEQGYTLEQVIMPVLKDFKNPLVFALKPGHATSRNITLP